MADFLLDTFSGIGALDTHTPETGGAWAADSATYDLSQFVLDGSGALKVDELGAWNWIYATAAPAGTTDFSMEAVLNVDMAGVTGSGEKGKFSLLALDAAASWNGFEIAYRVNANTNTAYLDIGIWADGANTWNDIGVYLGTPPTGQVTLRVAVSNVRQTYTVFVDNVQKYSKTMGASVPALTLTGFYYEVKSTATKNVLTPSKIQGWTGTYVAPTEPPPSIVCSAAITIPTTVSAQGEHDAAASFSGTAAVTLTLVPAGAGTFIAPVSGAGTVVAGALGLSAAGTFIAPVQGTSAVPLPLVVVGATGARGNSGVGAPALRAAVSGTGFSYPIGTVAASLRVLVGAQGARVTTAAAAISLHAHVGSIGARGVTGVAHPSVPLRVSAAAIAAGIYSGAGTLPLALQVSATGATPTPPADPAQLVAVFTRPGIRLTVRT